MAAAQARRQLEIDDRIDPVRPQRQIAAAQRGGDGLREAADLDHPLEAVERRQPRSRRPQLEIGEDLVLDDDDLMPLDEFEDAMRDRRRQRQAGRIVERRDGQVEPRRARGEQRAERLDVRPFPRQRRGDDLDPVRLEQRRQTKIAGIVDRHDVARLDEEAHREVDRLRGRVRSARSARATRRRRARRAARRAGGAAARIRRRSRSASCEKRGRARGRAAPAECPLPASTIRAASQSRAARRPGRRRARRDASAAIRRSARAVRTSAPAPAAGAARRRKSRRRAAPSLRPRRPGARRPRRRSISTWRARRRAP